MKSSLRVAQLAVGDTHFLLLTAAGSVYGMGSCVYGELGLGVVAPFVSVLQRVTRFDRGEYDDDDDGDGSSGGSSSGSSGGSSSRIDSGGDGACCGHTQTHSGPAQSTGRAVYVAAGTHYSAVIVRHTSGENVSTGGTSTGGISSGDTSTGGALSTGGTNSLYTFGHGAYYKLGHGMCRVVTHPSDL